jgi:hypothetical protein
MARTRYIKPAFFLDEEISELSSNAKLLFIGLWCLADKRGRMEDKPKQIKAQVFPYDNLDCEALLRELSNREKPFINRYLTDNKRYIQVINFQKHQNPHHTEKDSVIPAPPPQIPNTNKGLTVKEPLLNGYYKGNDNGEWGTDYCNSVQDAKAPAQAELKPDFAVEPAKEPEPWSESLASCQKIKNISPAMVASWRSTYPALDLLSEIQKADTWAVSNNKTCSRWGRFVNNWLKNAQKGPVDTRTGQSSKSPAQVSLDPLAVALCECWLENQTGKAPDKTTAEATCKLYYNDIKQYLDLWRDDLDGAAAFLSEFAQEKRKQGYNRWPLSWATKAAALKVAEKEAGR